MVLACATFLLAVAAAPSPSRTVAITFDDLPAAGARNPDEDRTLTTADIRSINTSILATLRAHHVPATGFVNERGIASYPDSAARREILAQWTAAGMDLGNHTYSHADFNTLSIEQFRTEVERGEASIAPLLRKAGKKLSYFRFPMNHTGDTAVKRDAAARYLAGRGYQTATCTIDTEDFAFERAFRAMFSKGDLQTAQKLRQEYLRYTAEEID
ncbi:MAG TPA: polysaccharide deacetylase family protein [Myxococcales bacterium]|nr:polysaccharide deacetylase family protein [Myxococcales bacterium]